MSWNIDLPTALYFDLSNAGSDEFVAFRNEMAAQTHIAIDTETTGLINWKDIPLYWSLAWGQKRATLHASLLPYFREIFDDPAKHWIFANAKFDMHMLANVGVKLAGKIVCTQVQHSLLYDDKPHDLKFMAKHLLGWTWADFQDQFGKIGKKQTAEDVIRRAETENLALLVEYAANDSWGTWNCYLELEKQLRLALTHSLFREKPPYINTLHDLFWKVEMPYTKVLWKMERHGIRIDQEQLIRAEPGIIREIVRIEKEIAKQVGYVLNPKSPQQLTKYFFDEQKLQPSRWTKGGKSGVRSPSTDKVALDRIAEEHPVGQLVLDHRLYTKLHGTYITGLVDLLDPNGYIHTSYHQDVARTGRISSKSPNLQNIPVRTEQGKQIREAFVPDDDDHVLIVVDYEQLEMRLLAAASLEQTMIDIFKRNWDIHMGNASFLYGIPYEDLEHAKKVDKKVKAGELPIEAITAYIRECLDKRDRAKTTGFGLNYGMGTTKLARQLGIPLPDAEKTITQYKKMYPAVNQFFEECVQETKQTGYAFSILGRRRNVQEITSHRKDECAQAERIAINMPIQSSAADVVKMGQINIDKVNLEGRYGCKQVMQVHDELVFRCPKDTCEDAKEEIQDLMEHPFYEDLAVHLAVSIGHGPSWGRAK